MKRRIVWIMMGAGLALPLAGCAGGPAKEEREPWTQSRWRDMIRDDQRRALPEQESAYRLMMDGIGDMIRIITGDTPFNAAKALLDPQFAEGRRRAVVYLADRAYGRREPYTTYYENMARTDDEPLVRATAVRALNRARDKENTALFVQMLDDREMPVRLEAAKALANMPDPAAVPKLIRRMSDPEEHLDVRIVAADALRSYRTAEVAQALVGALRGQFSVAWQARQSLKLMTGQDFRYDRTGWLDYLSGAQRPFG